MLATPQAFHCGGIERSRRTAAERGIDRALDLNEKVSSSCGVDFEPIECPVEPVFHTLGQSAVAFLISRDRAEASFSELKPTVSTIAKLFSVLGQDKELAGGHNAFAPDHRLCKR
jgi:hypothetical protein